LNPEVEIWGRWKGNKNDRVVNHYISVDQLPTDTKLAGILTIGGPVHYTLKDDGHIILQFLQSVVAPKMRDHFSSNRSNNIAVMLVAALLFSCHEPSLSHMICQEVRQRVHQGYTAIRGVNKTACSPVTKVPLYISQVENQVFIQDAITIGDVESGGSTSAVVMASTHTSCRLYSTPIHKPP
jgi:hypothetical protein